MDAFVASGRPHRRGIAIVAVLSFVATAVIHVVAAPVAGAATDGCALERAVRSVRADVPTELNFRNDLDEQVDVYWIDYAGNRVLYGPLAPHTASFQQTADTHPWVMATTDGRCLRLVVAGREHRTVGVWQPAPIETDRIAGADRYDTAARVSASKFPNGADVAYVASGLGFADALVGAPAARNDGAPMLLTDPHALPDPTIQELERLHPARIVVLGGSAAVSDDVVSQLRPLADVVERRAGADRYETAAEVARTLFPGRHGGTVLVTTGRSFPDALAAAGQPNPVLLVDGVGIPPSTSTMLQQLAPDRITIVGGTNAVSDSIEHDLATYSPEVVRLEGVDRYETAALTTYSLEGPYATAVVASGASFADALVAGVIAAPLAPLLLVPRDCVPFSVRDALFRFAIRHVTLVGGAGVLSDDLADEPVC